MNKKAFFGLLVLSMPLHAELIIKCQLSATKVVYQTTPCGQAESNQKVVEIKQMSPDRQAQAQAQFQNWQATQAATEAAKAAIDAKNRDEQRKQETVNALQRVARAQEQQAKAALEQARLAEQNAYLRQQGGTAIIYPYYPYNYPSFNRTNNGLTPAQPLTLPPPKQPIGAPGLMTTPGLMNTPMPIASPKTQ